MDRMKEVCEFIIDTCNKAHSNGESEYRYSIRTIMGGKYAIFRFNKANNDEIMFASKLYNEIYIYMLAVCDTLDISLEY